MQLPRAARYLPLVAAPRTLAITALLIAAPMLAGSAALADQTRNLHLAAVQVQFTSASCLNVSCTLAQATVDGRATSNLATGTGAYHADLILDFSPGVSCDIVDESSTFTFDIGTIYVHSRHEDCATSGLRIDTTFQVTGGTGAFDNANGGGREFSAAKSPVVTYIGSIAS